jgi:hypothetical protein
MEQNMEPASFGKWVIIFGVIIVAVGAVIWLVGKTGVPLGSLPGDISYERPGFSFKFPLVTSIVISLILTAILNIALWFFRR